MYILIEVTEPYDVEITKQMDGSRLLQRLRTRSAKLIFVNRTLAEIAKRALDGDQPPDESLIVKKDCSSLYLNPAFEIREGQAVVNDWQI